MSANQGQRIFRTSPPGMGVAPILAFKSAISLVGPTKRLVPESAILNRNEFHWFREVCFDHVRLTTALAVFIGVEWDTIEFELPVVFASDIHIGEVTFVQLRIRTTYEKDASNQKRTLRHGNVNIPKMTSPPRGLVGSLEKEEIEHIGESSILYRSSQKLKIFSGTNFWSHMLLKTG